MGKTLLRKVTTTLAVLACLLQLASIASPGWIIYIKGNIEQHHSLFYRKTCKVLADESKCRVQSFHDLHTDLRARLKKAQVSREKTASVDFENNSLICKQVLTVTAASLGMIMVLSQIIQTVKKKTFTRLIVLSAASATTSAGIVIAVACNDIVHLYYQMELQQMDDHRDHTYVGFPYCLGMLLGSALLHFFSLCSIASQLHTPRIRVKKTMPIDNDNISVSTSVAPITKVPITKINEVPITKISEVPITKISEVPKPTIDKGKDNPVFSEKL